MQKKFLITLAFLALIFPSIVMAQGMMMGGSTEQGSDSHTAREEAEGREVWIKFKAKELACADLSDDNFVVLGEYFMGQMMGESHEAMNNMIIKMIGDDGEMQMHLTLGKRLSGCDKQAVLLSENMTFMPMIEMMGKYHTVSTFDNDNSRSMLMMNDIDNDFDSKKSVFDVVSLVLLWCLAIVGIISIIKWFAGKSCCSGGKKDSAEKPKTDLKS